MPYALLIIDMQQGLFDTDPAPFEATEVIARINALAARTRATGNVVIIVQHDSKEDTLGFGSAGWELVPGIETSPEDVRIRKTTPDAFLRTDLEKELAARNITELYACGYASDFCLDTSVRSAAAHGFAVNLIADAHTTHDKPHLPAKTIREHHTLTLTNIKSFGVPIVAVTTQDVLKH